jgi:hypothetical protein
MPDMNSEQIRDIAVRCVEGFLNEKTPLSVGLAKEASSNDLNLEQIKRACEVANTVTHLKLMQLSEDRTFEFPLCKVAEVMKSIVGTAPEAGEPIEKAASVVASGDGYAGPEFSTHEKTLFFIKEAAANEKALELLNDRAIVLQSELTKVAAEVRKDSAWLDKMSSVKTDNFAELSVLISGAKADRRDFGEHCMFKEAEMKQVNKLAELYKEARALVAEMATRQQMDKQASELTKEAMFGAVARGIGTVAGKVMAAPFSAAAKTIGSPIMAGVKNLNNKLVGTAAGKAVGLSEKPLTLAQKGTSKAVKVGAPVAAAAAVDSLSYRMSGGPGYHSNGASRDVWDALQS